MVGPLSAADRSEIIYSLVPDRPLVGDRSVIGRSLGGLWLFASLTLVSRWFVTILSLVLHYSVASLSLVDHWSVTSRSIVGHYSVTIP